MKRLLFLYGRYYDSLIEVSELVKKNISDYDFQKELLSCYADGMLDGWVENLPSYNSLNKENNELISILYKSIVGEKIPNVYTDFSELGELSYCNCGCEKIPIENRNIYIKPRFFAKLVVDGRPVEYMCVDLKFVFKVLKKENNTIKFSLRHSDEIIEIGKLFWAESSVRSEVEIAYCLHESISKRHSYYSLYAAETKIANVFFKDKIDVRFPNGGIYEKLFRKNENEESRVAEFLFIEEGNFLTVNLMNYEIGLYCDFRDGISRLNYLFKDMNMRLPSKDYVKMIPKGLGRESAWISESEYLEGESYYCDGPYPKVECQCWVVVDNIPERFII